MSPFLAALSLTGSLPDLFFLNDLESSFALRPHWVLLLLFHFLLPSLSQCFVPNSASLAPKSLVAQDC